MNIQTPFDSAFPGSAPSVNSDKPLSNVSSVTSVHGIPVLNTVNIPSSAPAAGSIPTGKIPNKLPFDK